MIIFLITGKELSALKGEEVEGVERRETKENVEVVLL